MLNMFGMCAHPCSLLLPIASLCVVCFVVSVDARRPTLSRASIPERLEVSGRPGTQNCTWLWFEQKIDHFNWAAPLGGPMTFSQRYCKYDKYWKGTGGNAAKGPIFFYVGNEDYVDLYVNNTGLMWENAQQFGALIIFAEHRYYGESLPFAEGSGEGCMNWLTTEQAMADYAYLIKSLKRDLNCEESPVIAFGGSYGGMTAAWMRMKYPYILDGAVAASAPIWSFTGMHPSYDYNAFSKVVATDAGVPCRDHFKASLPRMTSHIYSSSGREMLARVFRTCAPLHNETEVGKGSLL